MAGQLEFGLRATLCRELAQREPANRVFWIAEAETWARLSEEANRGVAKEKISSGIVKVPEQPDWVSKAY
jgi:hypothetical protein